MEVHAFLLLSHIMLISNTPFYIKLYRTSEYMTIVQEDLLRIVMGTKEKKELFTIKDAKNGSIVQSQSRKGNVLDIEGGNTNLIVFPEHGFGNQIFKLKDTHISNTVYNISNGDKCLKVQPNKKVAKADCDKNDTRQLFEFEYKVDDKSTKKGKKKLTEIRKALIEVLSDLCEIENMESGRAPRNSDRCDFFATDQCIDWSDPCACQ